MAAPLNLLIFGASTRAAAFSALRAGLQPWCADLFADADLRRVCPVTQIPGRNYPAAFLNHIDAEVAGPWMFCGGLENHVALVNRLARRRPLWGCDGAAIRRARWFSHWHDLLREAGCPSPDMLPGAKTPPPGRRWLVKPVAGAGGSGIHFWQGKQLIRPSYLQEYLEGPACAAIYMADGQRARLLGVTRQLVGESWLHARPFHYCGSIGPLPLAEPSRLAFEKLGTALTAGCHLRGLFGVDAILRDGVPYPVEVNPRYTASVEVLEYATGMPALAWHRAIFDATAPTPRPHPADAGVVGKAILFARAKLAFPADGPWLETLRKLFDPWQRPAFADIPAPGTAIEAGRPVLSFFVTAESVAACETTLRRVALDLDCVLFGSAMHA